MRPCGLGEQPWVGNGGRSHGVSGAGPRTAGRRASRRRLPLCGLRCAVFPAPGPGRKFARAAPSERPPPCGFRGPVWGWRASLGPGRGRRPPPPVPVRLDPFCSCRVSYPGLVRGESPAAGRPGAASPGWAASPSSVRNGLERRDVDGGRRCPLRGRSLAFREGEGERCSRGAGFWRSWRKGRNAPSRVRSAGILPRGSRFSAFVSGFACNTGQAEACRCG